MSPEELERFEKDSLLHELQTKMDDIIKLVNDYPNDMKLGGKIRHYIWNTNKIGAKQ
tara:strand:- start:284 stop:454 length:171 start_codon:yes stop_codon:yes gene_type:complete